MRSSFLRAITAASLLTTTAAAPAVADNLGAALVGGLLGGVIVNEVNKNKRRTVVRSSSVSSATRAHNRETQTALNYFGFSAGTPDGVLGRRSREATRQYQMFMGFPQSGNLTQYERDYLVTSYNRALTGGTQVAKAMQSPQGIRSILKVWHGAPAGNSGGFGYAGLPIEVSNAVDEIAAAGDPTGDQLLQRTGFMQLADLNDDGRNDYLIDTSAAGIPYWCNSGGASCTVMVFASTPQGYERNDFTAGNITTADFTCTRGECDRTEAQGTTLAAAPAPQPVPTAPVPQGGTVLASGGSQSGLGGIQLFATPAAPVASLTSHCSKVSLLTSSNGGYMTVSSITDPELALGEQFCLARSYAINNGETLVASLQGVTSAQVDAQCDQFGPALKPYVAQLSSGDSSAVAASMQKFVLQSNMSVEQLKNTAQICLFSGYRRDNMDVALGASLLLVGLGQQPYAELIGHHLALGFGSSVDFNRAQGWYQAAVTALESGAEPVFAPGQPERVALVKAASTGLTQPGLPKPVQASSGGAALPTFGSNN
ncbi:peptidoglycan-binding domain-containing protein [Tritonibacter scottomollicae]|uniref:Putative peptidoglycan binding protein n=1 Tax=Tritonibacter scottomollicae TaxID=483013 RepID=A0A2T1AP97_TRISK|nr:peptidoglycan-binding domain-containing protein [Tritonibacter scottomollicae]PRZ50392.1 putative peptidoglycan binding protein [Tritonibacter scottomollicae]